MQSAVPTVDRSAVRRTPAVDAETAVFVDRGAVHNPPAVDAETAVFVDRGAVRRRAGMNGGGCFGKDQSAETVRDKRNSLIIIEIHIPAVFHDPGRHASIINIKLAAGGKHDIGCRAAFGDLELAAVDRDAVRRPAVLNNHAAAVDRGAVRRAAGRNSKSPAFVERGVLRRAAVLHIQIAVVVDRGAVRRPAVHHVHFEVVVKRFAVHDGGAGQQLVSRAEIDAGILTGECHISSFIDIDISFAGRPHDIRRRTPAVDKQATAAGHDGAVRRPAVPDMHAAVGVDRDAVHRAAEDGYDTVDIDRGTVHNAAGRDVQEPPAFDRGVDRRRTGVNGRGSLGKNASRI